jgi:hypothetical protein
MRNLKMLGLAVVAALALTALLGASSASAERLCKVEGPKDCLGQYYPVGTKIHAQLKPGTKLSITYGFVTQSCKASTLDAELTDAGGDPTAELNTEVTAAVTGFTMQECTYPWTAESLGTLRLTWAGNSKQYYNEEGLRLAYKGPEGTCVMRGAGENADGSHRLPGKYLLGGAPATISEVNTEYQKVSGTLACPKAMFLTAEYEVTTPTPLFPTLK